MMSLSGKSAFCQERIDYGRKRIAIQAGDITINDGSNGGGAKSEAGASHKHFGHKERPIVSRELRLLGHIVPRSFVAPCSSFTLGLPIVIVVFVMGSRELVLSAVA